MEGTRGKIRLEIIEVLLDHTEAVDRAPPPSISGPSALYLKAERNSDGPRDVLEQPPRGSTDPRCRWRTFDKQQTARPAKRTTISRVEGEDTELLTLSPS
ncbi:unnamed protein product [Arctogadus glacialis]